MIIYKGLLNYINKGGIFMGIFKDYISKRMVFLIVPIVAMIIVLGIDSFFPYLQKIFVDDIFKALNFHSLIVPIQENLCQELVKM